MILRRLIPIARGSRFEIVGGLGLALAGVAVELLQPWPVKWLVDYVLGDHAAPGIVAGWLSFLGEQELRAVIVIALTIVGLAVAHKLAQLASNLLIIRAGGKLVFELRCRAFDQLHRLSLSYHDRKKVGESLYRVAYDAHAAQTLLSGAVAPSFSGAFLFAGVLLIMLQLDVLMTVVTLAAAPAFVVFIKTFGRRIDRSSTAYHQQEEKLVASAQESIASIRAVQAFTMEAQSSVRFRGLAGQSLGKQMRLIFSQLQFSASVGIVMALATAAVVYVGAGRVLAGKLQLGDILVFLAYLGMLYHPVNAFCQSAAVIQSAGAQLRRVFEIIDSVPAVEERPGARVLPKVRGEIEYRGVCFEYEPGQPILKDISVAVPAGQIVALVGASGAGKTTFSSMLNRFYDPAAGAILLDGVDLRELKLEWLRSQVSVVLQDPILFAGTIRENIAAGRPKANLDEIVEAARRAQLHEQISALPMGYETVLGERGVNLSGGQRQRLSIARAFLKQAPILVMDEPTSGLDVQTEHQLLSAVRELLQGRTTFLIAHRLSTVRLADRILVLKEGCLVEEGTHEHLLVRGGDYARMVWRNSSMSGASAETELTTLT